MGSDRLASQKIDSKWGGGNGSSRTLEQVENAVEPMLEGQGPPFGPGRGMLLDRIGNTTANPQRRRGVGGNGEKLGRNKYQSPTG